MALKVISQKGLRTICKIMKVYISQDADGTVQMWDKKPHITDDYWECDEGDSILCVPFSYPYNHEWQKSLITPNSWRGY